MSSTATEQMLADKYRKFARDVLIEDSGLAVWSDPEYQIVRQLAQSDRDSYYEEDTTKGET